MNRRGFFRGLAALVGSTALPRLGFGSGMSFPSNGKIISFSQGGREIMRLSSEGNIGLGGVAVSKPLWPREPILNADGAVVGMMNEDNLPEAEGWEEVAEAEAAADRLAEVHRRIRWGGNCEHDIWVQTDNLPPEMSAVVGVANDDDPHYHQYLRSREEVDEMIAQLQAARDEAWPTGRKTIRWML